MYVSPFFFASAFADEIPSTVAPASLLDANDYAGKFRDVFAGLSVICFIYCLVQ